MERNGCRIEITEHQDALIGNVVLSVAGDLDAAQKEAAAMLEKAAAEITAEGGIVGHIKAYVKQETGVMLSTTGGEVSSRAVTPAACTAECVNIIFGLKPDRLQEILLRVYGRS